MASRHRGGFIILTRDHVWETLNLTVPSAEQPVGRVDIAGRAEGAATCHLSVVKTRGPLLGERPRTFN
jgi:hypothetical protein